MGRLCRRRRRLVLLLPPGISDRSYIRSDSIRSMPTPSRAIFVWRPYGSLLVVGPSFSFGTARARWQSWAGTGRYFFDAIEVPRNLFFCCWESLPRNVSKSLEGFFWTSIWLWRRGPLVITLWPWRRIDIKLRVSAGLFILNAIFPLSWEERITLRGTSLSTDANCPSLDCSFGFIRAGAFDEQEANVVIIEDDSLKQEFHKQAHETLLLSSSEEEWNWPHFHWPVSDSCQVRRMTDGTNWISRDILEVRSTTLGKEMRRSTRLYTYEESLTDGQEVDNVSFTAGLSAFLIQLHHSLRLLLVLGSGYPSFWKSFLLKWGKPDLESFFTAFLSKWEIHSQGNRRLKMDSSTEDAFQGKSHDTAFSRFLICLIDE